MRPITHFVCPFFSNFALTSLMLTADYLKEHFGLEPLPGEGGYYAETYRSSWEVPEVGLPAAYTSRRSGGTAIYYLLTPDTFSALHRLPGDEIYHFYLGDPVELLQLHPDGTGTISVLGQEVLAGMHVQHVVPGGTWQGSRLVAGGHWALMGTTMAPGFAFEDFEAGERDYLCQAYPAFSDQIKALTQ